MSELEVIDPSLIIKELDKKEKFVDGKGVTGIFGDTGDGKTLMMVMLALKAIKRGEVVFSNIDINGAIRRSIEQIPGIKIKGELFLDEGGVIFSALDFKDNDEKVKRKVIRRVTIQNRKLFSGITFTTTNPLDIDVMFRRTLKKSIHVRKGFWPRTHKFKYLNWFDIDTSTGRVLPEAKGIYWRHFIRTKELSESYDTTSALLDMPEIIEAREKFNVGLEVCTPDGVVEFDYMDSGIEEIKEKLNYIYKNTGIKQKYRLAGRRLFALGHRPSTVDLSLSSSNHLVEKGTNSVTQSPHGTQKQ